MSSSDYFDRAARAFQQVSRTDRAELLKDDPPDHHHTRPFLGWIGPNYHRGTLLIAKFPGEVPKSHERNLAHDQLEDELDDFPQCSDPATAMRRLAELYAKQEGTVGMNTIVAEVLTALKQQRGAIAYANICPYRATNGDEKHLRGYKTCLQLVVAPLLVALEPDTVIYLNSEVGDQAAALTWRRAWAVPHPVNDPYTLKRKRRDSMGLHREGKAVLELAARDSLDRDGPRKVLA